MRQRRSNDFVRLVVAFEPFEKRVHLLGKPARSRRFVVDARLSFRSRDNLHWVGGVIPPCANDDLAHVAAPGRKQGGVPSEQPLVREWLVVVLSSIQHHFDDAFDIAVGGGDCACVDPQTARDR